MDGDKFNYGYPVMPDGNGGFSPCPELLTEDEAIRYIRLDTLGREHPDRTLEWYRSEGHLRATKISNVNFYRRIDLDKFMETMSNLGYERKTKK